jgi:hypothetical protein
VKFSEILHKNISNLFANLHFSHASPFGLAPQIIPFSYLLVQGPTNNIRAWRQAKNMLPNNIPS